MPYPAITEFLEGRKEAYLKKNLKSNLSEEDILSVNSDANVQYAFVNWLPLAAARAKQLSLVSHPIKFSHPSAKDTTPVIANCPTNIQDGYLRTGNLGTLPLDVVGNAAALDVYRFVMLPLKNGQTILENLEKDTLEAQEMINKTGLDYATIRNELLQIKTASDQPIKTSGLAKQVYFPIDETHYHLLTLLTPSAAIYQLKDKINTIRFSDQAKEAREDRKKNHFNEAGLTQIVGLAGIRYGGSNSQNLSVLNSQNGGVALLLSSVPPTLNKRTINPPKLNFFDLKHQWLTPFEESFIAFHKNLATDANNIKIRNKRDHLIELVQLSVADNVKRLRAEIPPNWSDSDTYQNLPIWQKKWLDEQYKDDRTLDDDYTELAANAFAHWFMHIYSKLLDKNNLKKLEFDDIDLTHVRTQSLKNKEVFA